MVLSPSFSHHHSSATNERHSEGGGGGGRDNRFPETALLSFFSCVCVCVGRPVCRSSVSITQGACSCRTTLDDLEPSPSFDSAIRLHPRTTRLAAREYLLPTNRPSPIRRIRMGEEARKFVFQSDLNKYSYSSTICNILFVKDNISEERNILRLSGEYHFSCTIIFFHSIVDKITRY